MLGLSVRLARGARRSWPCRHARHTSSSSGASSAIVTLADHDITVGASSTYTLGTRNTGPRVLVSSLDLTIREGERWAILGVNGCGKSTLAKVLGQRLTGVADGPNP